MINSHAIMERLFFSKNEMLMTAIILTVMDQSFLTFAIVEQIDTSVINFKFNLQ